MSFIALEKHGGGWRGSIEGPPLKGLHPVTIARKGLPEAMAQAVVEHCAMAGEDAQDFVVRLVREIAALAPARASQAEAQADALVASVDRQYEWQIAQGHHATRWPMPEPRKARVPRKAAAVGPEAQQAPAEPVAASTEEI